LSRRAGWARCSAAWKGATCDGTREFRAGRSPPGSGAGADLDRLDARSGTNWPTKLPTGPVTAPLIHGWHVCPTKVADTADPRPEALGPRARSGTNQPPAPRAALLRAGSTNARHGYPTRGSAECGSPETLPRDEPSHQGSRRAQCEPPDAPLACLSRDHRASRGAGWRISRGRDLGQTSRQCSPSPLCGPCEARGPRSSRKGCGAGVSSAAGLRRASGRGRRGRSTGRRSGSTRRRRGPCRGRRGRSSPRARRGR